MEELKKKVAEKALNLVKNNMTLGIGSGTTMNIFIEELKKRITDGLEVQCVPTSYDAYLNLIKNGINVKNIEQVEKIDLAIDGADFITPDLKAIKGYGGALTQEKIVDYFADSFYVIVDKRKAVDRLRGKVPLEIIPSSLSIVKKYLEEKDIKGKLRYGNGKMGPVITDNGNWLFDIEVNEILDADKFEIELNSIPGVVENGIFTKITGAYVSYENRIEEYKK